MSTSTPRFGRRYALFRKLGEGGMGVVWEAADTRTGDRVAREHLTAAFDGNPESVERLRTEAEIPMLLDHPRIVWVLSLGFPPEHDPPFFVMELLPGRTLDLQIGQGGPLPVGDAFGIVAQALDGLAAAHQAGVVHAEPPWRPPRASSEPPAGPASPTAPRRGRFAPAVGSILTAMLAAPPLLLLSRALG